MTNVLVTFDGLMIFHKHTNGFYEVGILDAKLLSPHIPQHEFRIKITPDPHKGSGDLPLGPSDLDPFLRLKKAWLLEVRNTSGNVESGIHADESRPDRHSKDKTDKRFGWIVNIEGNEFHSTTLSRESGMLSPVIHLSKGELYAFCKTGGVQKKQNRLVKDADFGYLAGLLALDIDTSAGQTVTLKEEAGADVFTLPAGASYRVDISNDNITKSTDSHFHAFYEMIFTGVPPNQWFDFEAREPEDPSPDACPSENGPTPKGIPPYKCGGLLINAGGQPLS